MKEDDRVWVVRQLVSDHVKSPSLKHIRDPYAVGRLAQEIVRRLDRDNSLWRKWNGPRETLLKSALGCWIPVEGLRDFLNAMPGPTLTRTDVAERFKALEEEESEYLNDDLKKGCLALYEREKAESTELPAIIGRLREHVEEEEERLRAEQRERYEQSREEDRIAREQRLLSGADCGWTQLKKSPHWYCRVNGRTYRASPTKDKRWNLHRTQSTSDEEDAPLIGTYRGRGEATKAIREMAYRPEPRW